MNKIKLLDVVLEYTDSNMHHIVRKSYEDIEIIRKRNEKEYSPKNDDMYIYIKWSSVLNIALCAIISEKKYRSNNRDFIIEAKYNRIIKEGNRVGHCIMEIVEEIGF